MQNIVMQNIMTYKFIYKNNKKIYKKISVNNYHIEHSDLSAQYNMTGGGCNANDIDPNNKTGTCGGKSYE